eukprot:5793323-Ditylum_brightwellii.AAC.1
MYISGTYILSAVVLANEVEKKRFATNGSDVIDKLKKTHANNNGEPLDSDCEVDEETVFDLLGGISKEQEKYVYLPEPSGKCSFGESTITA